MDATVSPTEQVNLSSNPAAKMWAKYGEAYFPCEEAVKTLKPGQYTIESSQSRGIYFNEIKVNTDEIMVLPDTASEKIINQINEFWKKEEKYKTFNFIWKRGFLLWGPPGSGKTTTIQLVAKSIIDSGGICVFVKNPSIAAAGLEILRKIEPTRPVIVILEDIDAITQRYSESELLALLDGELQIQNVVFLATTNYPQKLDKRLVNRPSRFDVVQKIDYPNEAARRLFLERKNPALLSRFVTNDENSYADDLRTKIAFKTETLLELERGIESAKVVTNVTADQLETLELKNKHKKQVQHANELRNDIAKLTTELELTIKPKCEIDVWVEETNKFSIAHLKELILSVELFEIPFEASIDRLKKMMNTALNENSGGTTNI